MITYTGRALQRISLSSVTLSQISTRCPVNLYGSALGGGGGSWFSSLASQQQPSPSSSSSPSISNAKKSESLDESSSPSSTVPAVRRKRRRREILRMDESELEGYAVLVPKLPLIELRGEAQSNWFKAFAPSEKNIRNMSDVFAVMHHDWDLRAVSVKRWWSSIQTEKEIHMQAYDPKRVSILGSDLGAAHFIVFRQGKVRFRGRDDWIDSYRKDKKPGQDDDDLPAMRFEHCTLPTKYDPNYRLEAIDCSGVGIRYEGLLNFQNLDFVKWLSFKDCPHIDDWCVDRIARCFHETLEYIDLSGCNRVSDRGIGTLHRCRKLKTLRVEEMSHVKNLEIVCALLEDHNPDLTVFGIDYETKTHQLRSEAEEIERKAKEEAEKLEAQTATIQLDTEHRSGPFATP